MEKLRDVYRWLQERRNAFRIPLLILGFAAFGIGCYISFQQLALSAADIQLIPLFSLVILAAPSLAYGGIGLSLLARSAGASLSLGHATAVGAYAYLAELLPIPGGAIVRAGALVGAGCTVRRSTVFVLFTAILWIALAMIGAGLTLLSSSVHLAWPVLIAGTIFSLIITTWLWRASGAAIAMKTLAHRIFGIVLMCLRIQFAFATLGTSVGLLDAMPFVLALLLGSSASIAPAGLGISESLAALAATASPYPPEVAFLAVGLDRIVSLATCAIFALAVQYFRQPELAVSGDR